MGDASCVEDQRRSCVYLVRVRGRGRGRVRLRRRLRVRGRDVVKA